MAVFTLGSLFTDGFSWVIKNGPTTMFAAINSFCNTLEFIYNQVPDPVYWTKKIPVFVETRYLFSGSSYFIYKC